MYVLSDIFIITSATDNSYRDISDFWNAMMRRHHREGRNQLKLGLGDYLEV